MKASKQLLIICQLLPCYSFAHGEEVLLTLFLPIIPGIIFLFALNFIRLSPKIKTVLIVVYVLALFLPFFITRNWSYNDNVEMINLLVTLSAPALVLVAYLYLRNKEKVSRSKEADKFLKEEEQVKENEI